MFYVEILDQLFDNNRHFKCLVRHFAFNFSIESIFLCFDVPCLNERTTLPNEKRKRYENNSQLNLSWSVRRSFKPRRKQKQIFYAAKKRVNFLLKLEAERLQKDV